MGYNLFSDASKKYREMKRRGFVKESDKNLWQEFILTAAAKRKGEDYVGEYTAEWYAEEYGLDLSYESDVNFEEYQEAAEKYQDMKKRGFIHESKKNIEQEFIKTVTEDYIGVFTAEWYSLHYGLKLEYGTSESFEDYRSRVIAYYLERHKAELMEILDKNDFLKMAEKYGEEEGLDINEIFDINTFSDLLTYVQHLHLHEKKYFFRSTENRNRRIESEEIEAFFDEADVELNKFEDDIKHMIRRFELN